MGTKPSFIALTVGALLAPAAFAGSSADVATLDAANAKTVADEHLVVIGRQLDTPLNIAANVAVITAEEIALSGATDLAGVLRGQSGIQVSDNGVGPVFAMRGFAAGQAANNTLILVDGRRLNNIDIAAPSLSAVSVSQIERIEILSGSAGVLYGDQAVGGVINIITKRPEGQSGGASIGGGSFNSLNASADFATEIGAGWHAFFGGHFDKSDNYRDHAKSETGSLLGRLEYRGDTNQFFAETSYFDNDRLLAGSLNEAQLNDNPRQANEYNATDYQHEITKAVRSGYQHQLNGNWALGADVDYSDTRVNYISWGGQGTTERSLLAFSPKAIGKYQTRAGELKLITGFDLSRGESEFESAYMSRGNTQKLWAGFVQASVPLTEHFSYVVGGRYAEVTDDIRDGNTFPNGGELDNDAHALELGVNYRPSDASRFYLRAEDNFRFAKVDEQAYTSQGSLRPQTGRSYEAGWDYLGNAQALRLSLYRLSLEDEIVFDPSAETPTGGFFQGSNVNADESRRYGAMLDWDWQISDVVKVGLDYQYTDAEFTKGPNDGKALSWVARHSGRAFAGVNLAEHWQLYLDASYTGSRFVEGDNANAGNQLDAFWLANAALNFNIDAINASLRVDNLFDEQYAASGYYSEWGNGYYPGEGRKISLTLGVRY
ncbi:TonB-dependent receptor [Shewanella khirikhana]|uniref:Fe(3+) dicitrate transport protein FecA n=1 Tax=Shewanella khirikhana TaxID=1965282 RepID=A0ABM7DPJ0_9GAMM|nr:TonB-dependent receptor [Shewanella khirikhana]AZQ11590.1 Fe(3+) dicitrate transport protein FecA precursor [Shewanella khirikhana]